MLAFIYTHIHVQTESVRPVNTPRVGLPVGVVSAKLACRLLRSFHNDLRLLCVTYKPDDRNRLVCNNSAWSSETGEVRRVPRPSSGRSSDGRKLNLILFIFKKSVNKAITIACDPPPLHVSLFLGHIFNPIVSQLNI